MTDIVVACCQTLLWYVVKQTFVCRVDAPLIFKNVRRRKRVYNKCKSEKNAQG